MNKIFRIAITIIAVAVALYLMVSLFMVFLVLLGLGIVYVFFMRFFSKKGGNINRSENQQDGVIIEHEPIDKRDDINR
ncbi:hypothetical protein ISG33_07385 [Glaciecola sp. MH2013]|uniref:hypothetical protein n=1 Tax=Glaciecola sp. MH2013 TaxID=2785524 RepID=UPI00189DAC4E|nr:hypothetical protein [Glaciecola sp. MH2013]MBF7073217.1 hypothetical protein [Glaciecola sp. MH2013]